MQNCCTEYNTTLEQQNLIQCNTVLGYQQTNKKKTKCARCDFLTAVSQ